MFCRRATGGLVRIRQRVRERYCEARFDKLNDVADWAEQYRMIRAVTPNSLEEYLSELQARQKKRGRRK